jgi:hypothetical protein
MITGDTPVSQPTWKPTRKMTASGIIGAITVGVLAILDSAGVDEHTTVYGVVGAALTWLGGYIFKSRAGEAG